MLKLPKMRIFEQSSGRQDALMTAAGHMITLRRKARVLEWSCDLEQSFGRRDAQMTAQIFAFLVILALWAL